MATYQYSTSILGVISGAIVINPENMPFSSHFDTYTSDPSVVSAQHLLIDTLVMLITMPN